MAASLTEVADKRDKTIAFLNDCKANDIAILPPNINESNLEYTPTKDGIRFGLGAVKSLGDIAVDRILNARNKDGKFKNLLDFCSRVDLTKVNTGKIQTLISAGCIDQSGLNRAQMLFALPDLIEAAKAAKKSEEEITPVLFVPRQKDITDEEKGDAEYEALGFFLSHNPLDKFREKLNSFTSTDSLEFINEGSAIPMGGLITNLKQITTKAGKEMAFFDFEDLTGTIEVVVFSSMYLKNKHLFKKNKPVEVFGKVEIQCREVNGEEIITSKLILMKINELVEGKRLQKIRCFPKENDDFKKIRDIITSNPGETPVEIEYHNALVVQEYKILPKRDVLVELEGSCLTRRIYGN